MEASYKITLTDIQDRVFPKSAMFEINLLAMSYKDKAEITHSFNAPAEFSEQVVYETYEFEFRDLSTMLEFTNDLNNLKPDVICS